MRVKKNRDVNNTYIMRFIITKNIYIQLFTVYEYSYNFITLRYIIYYLNNNHPENTLVIILLSNISS